MLLAHPVRRPMATIGWMLALSTSSDQAALASCSSRTVSSRDNWRISACASLSSSGQWMMA